MDIEQIKDFLEEKYIQYNTPEYINSDPIQVPHQFTKKENIELSAFLTASIAWGNRKSIINNANKLMSLFDYSPYDFIINASKKEISNIPHFVHRTFNVSDLQYFLLSLQNIYNRHNGLEGIFTSLIKEKQNMKDCISSFHDVFFEICPLERTRKHIANPSKGSAAKRINMFLRWMVRKDNVGVDFGLWKNFPVSKLYIPLDLHVGNVARELGILKRKQNDWKALEEIMSLLKDFDPNDPSKYDYALFGLGIFEKF